MKRYVIVSVVLCCVGMLLAIGATLYVVSSMSEVPAVQELPKDAPQASMDTALSTDALRIVFGTSTVVLADVADEPREHQQGLSGRASLADHHGLFFVFAAPSKYGFWMPDMHFAIDIIWLDETMRVVTIKENATPESYPELFHPTGPALYVLEVPSGYARAHGIVEGAQATIDTGQ